MTNVINTRMQTIDELLDSPHREPEVVMSVNDLLRNVRTARNYLLAEKAHERFALSFLKREHARYKRTIPTPEGAEEREERLCLCSGSCPLKDGELPREIAEADTIEEGILAFQRSHNAHAPVLDDLSTAWHTLRHTVEDVLTVAVISLRHDVPPAELGATADQYTSVVDDVTDMDTVDPAPAGG